MTLNRTLAIATLALLAACASSPWTVDRFEAPEADVAGRHGFLYRPGEIAAPLVRRPELAAQTEVAVRAAIVAELLRKGYVEAADAAGADMVVSYQASGSRRFVESDQRRIGAPSPNELLTPGSVPPLPASELPPETSVRAVSLLVFAEDPSSGRLMWRGLVDAEIRSSSLEGVVRQLTDLARHIAQEFPARRATR